jgi:hypothetical protein
MPFFIKTFASEYLTDVTKALDEFVNSYECQQVHSVDSDINFERPDCRYYKIRVAYFADEHRMPEGGFTGQVVTSDYEFFGMKEENLKRELIESIEYKIQRTKLRKNYYPERSEHNRLGFEHWIYGGSEAQGNNTPYVAIQAVQAAPNLLGYRAVRRYYEEPLLPLSPLSKLVAEVAPVAQPREQYVAFHELPVQTLRRLVQLLDTPTSWTTFQHFPLAPAEATHSE